MPAIVPDIGHLNSCFKGPITAFPRTISGSDFIFFSFFTVKVVSFTVTTIIDEGELFSRYFRRANDWNPESKFHWQGIRKLQRESRIQDYHGLPYTGAILTFWIVTTEPYPPSRPFLSRHETKTSASETNRNPWSLSYIFQIKHEIVTSNQLRKAYKRSRFGFFDLIFKEVELSVSLDRSPL